MEWADVFRAALTWFCWPLGFAFVLAVLHELELPAWYDRTINAEWPGWVFLSIAVLLVPTLAWRRHRSWRVVLILVSCGAVSGAPLSRHDEIFQVALTCAVILAVGALLLSYWRSRRRIGGEDADRR